MPEPPAASATAPEVLVLVAHPQMEHSRANRALMRAAGEVAGASKGRVEVRDLYALYPDYLIGAGAEQALLAGAKLVVWQHPVHWYAMPPLMKLWLDEVLAFGWAYGPGGHALQGKDLWLALTTGGPQESYRPDSYNRYFFDAFLPPQHQCRLHVMLQSEVERIEPQAVVIKAGDGIRKIVNNSVIVSAGGVLPSDFLRAAGIEVDTKYGTA